MILKRNFVNFVIANNFMDEGQKNSEKNRSSLKDFLSRPLIKTDSRTLQYSGMGITLVVTILIFFWVGRWLDGKFDTKVTFTLILTFVGFAAGFYSFYLNVKKLTDEEKKSKS